MLAGSSYEKLTNPIFQRPHISGTRFSAREGPGLAMYPRGVNFRALR
jgi:hypothetical protein